MIGHYKNHRTPLRIYDDGVAMKEGEMVRRPCSDCQYRYHLRARFSCREVVLSMEDPEANESSSGRSPGAKCGCKINSRAKGYRWNREGSGGAMGVLLPPQGRLSCTYDCYTLSCHKCSCHDAEGVRVTKCYALVGLSTYSPFRY